MQEPCVQLKSACLSLLVRYMSMLFFVPDPLFFLCRAPMFVSDPFSASVALTSVSDAFAPAHFRSRPRAPAHFRSRPRAPLASVPDSAHPRTSFPDPFAPAHSRSRPGAPAHSRSRLRAPPFPTHVHSRSRPLCTRPLPFPTSAPAHFRSRLSSGFARLYFCLCSIINRFSSSSSS